MYPIEKIRNYILFLKKKCDLSITLHPIKKEALIGGGGLMEFNIHDNSYCIYLKTFPEVQRHCIDRQHRVLEKCKGGSFGGCCFAGCFEYVYPISNGTEVAGFISVGGYGCRDAEPYITATAKKYSIPKESLKQIYKTLKTPPSKEEIDALLLPLCDMLELAYIKSGGADTGDETLIDKVLRYVKRYHTCNITLDDICEQFSCSRFYISHVFKKTTQKTFREYLTALRIEDAKSLLRHSELSITEIAFSVGFNDSNYFSSVFKEHVGLSPRAYRSQGK